MQKIPARFTWLVMPAVLAVFMTFIISGISTFRALGLSPTFVSNWMQSWGISYVIAFPTLLLVLPVVRRLVGLIVAKP